MTTYRHYYLDDEGKWYQINLPEQPLGSGATGDVFPISNSMVAKIYNTAGYKTRGLLDKIITMAFKFRHLTELQNLPLAWPLGPLVALPLDLEKRIRSSKRLSQHEFCGYVMPRVYEHYNLDDVIALKQLRATTIDDKSRINIAAGIAEIVQICHNEKFVIGDINMRNIVVSADTLMPTIIDCDSFQIAAVSTTSPTPDVGTIDFSSPELLRRVESNNGKFSGVVRTQGDDCFALSVVIFKLLMNGRHPCDDERCLPNLSDLRRAIIARTFSYWSGSDSRAPSDEDADRYRLLDEEVKTLFEKVFVLGAPIDATDWIAPLRRYATTR